MAKLTTINGVARVRSSLRLEQVRATPAEARPHLLCKYNPEPAIADVITKCIFSHFGSNRPLSFITLISSPSQLLR